MTGTLNIQRFASLLSAEARLEDVERHLRRIGEWRMSREIGEIRETLAEALIDEQSGLQMLFAAFARSDAHSVETSDRRCKPIAAAQIAKGSDAMLEFAGPQRRPGGRARRR